MGMDQPSKGLKTLGGFVKKSALVYKKEACLDSPSLQGTYIPLS